MRRPDPCDRFENHRGDIVKKVLFLLLILGLTLTACAPAPAGEAPALPALGNSAANPGPTSTPGPTPTPAPHADVLDAIWAAVADSYVYVDEDGQIPGVDWQALTDEVTAQVDPAMPQEQFVDVVRQGLAALPDGAVIWQTKAEAVEDVKATVGGYEGIGVYVGARGEPSPSAVVLEVVDGSPAQSAGLAMHDRILAIDGVAMTADEGMAVVDRIRGPRDSDTVLTVQSPGIDPREVTVTRSQMSFAQQKSLFVERLADGAVGYMRFPAGVHPTLGQDFSARLSELGGADGVKGLILDLRISNNSTGWPLMVMLPLFGDGEMGTVINPGGASPLVIGGGTNLSGLPLVLLVGPDTQGTAEIFAAALQSAGVATVIGLPTPGQVEGMAIKRLPDGSELFIANSTFITPDGRDIGQEGVQPDIVVDADWGDVSAENDPVISAALDVLAQ